MFVPESLLALLERHVRLLFALCVAGIVAACLYPFDFITPNHITGAAGKGVEFAAPSIAYSADSVTKLAGVDRFTISLRIVPLAGPFNWGAGQVFGSGVSDKLGNFSIQQRRRDLCLMLGADSGEYPRCRLRIRDIVRGPELLWIDIVYDGTMLRSYVNGIARDSAAYDLPLGWSGSYPVVAGNSADFRHPWSGRIDTLALFSEALPTAGCYGGWRTGAWGRPVLLYAGLDSGGAVIRDGGTGASADLLVPGHYGPYHHKILEPLNLSDPYDIVVNVVGFVPLGFLFSLLIRRYRLDDTIRLILIVGFGLSLSLAMELLQAYLPTRNSGITDLVTNSAGMIPGYFLCRILYHKS